MANEQRIKILEESIKQTEFLLKEDKQRLEWLKRDNL